MALPKQVEAALAAADATLAAANGPPQAADLAILTQDGPTDPPILQAAPQPQAAPVAPPAPAEKPDAWEQRYRVLQGKYDAEVPRLHHQVRDLETNLSAAIERMDAIGKAKESAPAQSVAADPKDVENFGSDLVDMVSRVAGQAIGKAAQLLDARFTQFESQLAQLQDSVKGTNQHVAMTAEQAFFDRVTKLVPTWEAINADPAFLAWLAEVDPVYGLSRQAALTKAQSSLNAEQAAAVFKAFHGNDAPASAEPNPLDKQVSPKGAATVAPTQAQPQVITQAQITSFYDMVRRGDYRGREAEAAQIEQIINTALAEGRVR
jgi:hypothetical protein